MLSRFTTSWKGMAPEKELFERSRLVRVAVPAWLGIVPEKELFERSSEASAVRLLI